MKFILVAALVGLVLSLVGTPFAVRIFRRQGYGQLIRDDGPDSHHTKRGTPTMGGAVIIAATLIGYGVAHVGVGFSWSGLLVVFTMAGLGAVGFIDDFIKIRMQRSLGLNKTAKLVGQLLIAVAFGVLALELAEASTAVSFIRDTSIRLGAVGFIVWVYVMVSATSNGVNLTDGLDGLAAGSAAMVFAAYTVMTFWMSRNLCETQVTPGCYVVADPLDLAIVSAAAMGACFGFLWWNAAPAKIFMGDTGSLALGGALASLAVLSRTELLLVVLGGLFVVETLSVILQVVAFRGLHRRVFNMAPIHHHFELAGWPEFTVIVRFWIVAGLAVAFGLGLFYAEYLSRGPLP
ncbi:MAG TPA: phospho-N-acetylmuramoyl-pentapeptide-transferase [Mycobacteriales bacterium]|nr:phospho-N-acetylmuramoyl-pentapeptide-transferase [Mycobacteriales bacterium]